MISLFEPFQASSDDAPTDLRDLSSEFMSTMACCEEGNCCDPW